MKIASENGFTRSPRLVACVIGLYVALPLCLGFWIALSLLRLSFSAAALEATLVLLVAAWVGSAKRYSP